jgi:hypothetical protein
MNLAQETFSILYSIFLTLYSTLSSSLNFLMLFRKRREKHTVEKKFLRNYIKGIFIVCARGRFSPEKHQSVKTSLSSADKHFTRIHLEVRFVGKTFARIQKLPFSCSALGGIFNTLTHEHEIKS